MGTGGQPRRQLNSSGVSMPACIIPPHFPQAILCCNALCAVFRCAYRRNSRQSLRMLRTPVRGASQGLCVAMLASVCRS